MTVEPPAPGPLPKGPAPSLSARAPRPLAARLRPAVALAGGLVVSAVIGGALTWAFIAQPRLRAEARVTAAAARTEETRGAVRPAQVIAAQPASYDRLGSGPRPTPGGPPAAPTAGPAPGRDSARPNPPEPPRPRPPARTSQPSDGLPGQARSSGLFFASASGPPRPAATLPAGGGRDAAEPIPVKAEPAHATGRLLAPAPPDAILAGTILPAVLLTAVDTARPGPVVASLTEPVFDTVSGRRLLLPQGARLLGRHEGDNRHGDRRAFLTWERLILPNGKSLPLAGEPGVDPQGAVGLPGRTDRRLGPLATAALLAGAITTLGQAARDDHGGSSLLGDAGDAAAIEAAQVGGRLIDRELDVKPSIRLEAGARVRVLLTHDLVLEPYQP